MSRVKHWSLHVHIRTKRVRLPKKLDKAVIAACFEALREQLGTGMVDTKKALEEADGDVEKAVEILRLKGAKGNAKRADRSTSEGLIAARELDGKVTLIELACETDFVAKNDRFVALADKGYRQALLDDEHLSMGLNVYKGEVTYEAVAADLGYEYRDTRDALAS